MGENRYQVVKHRIKPPARCSQDELTDRKNIVYWDKSFHQAWRKCFSNLLFPSEIFLFLEIVNFTDKRWNKDRLSKLRSEIMAGKIRTIREWMTSSGYSGAIKDVNLETHHIDPTSRAGCDTDHKNTTQWSGDFHHGAYHKCFANMLLPEIFLFCTIVCQPGELWTGRRLHELREAIMEGDVESMSDWRKLDDL